MEFNKSNMYSQADKLKKSGWKQIGVAVDCDECYEEAVTLPGEIEEDITILLPDDEENCDTATDCGYCITPGMSYTPNQKWGQPYDPETGLTRGTIFPQLDYPFLGEGGKKR